MVKMMLRKIGSKLLGYFHKILFFNFIKTLNQFPF